MVGEVENAALEPNHEPAFHQFGHGLERHARRAAYGANARHEPLVIGMHA